MVTPLRVGGIRVIQKAGTDEMAELNKPWPAGSVIALICLAAYFFFAPRPLIPDVAWLLEASRRWLGGAVLYVDIVEVNPPLIFYEMVALTGGLLTPRTYVAGVCLLMAVSSIWIVRLRGGYLGLAAICAELAGGLTDFGQRDHLALIFVIPFLLLKEASKWERFAIGVWAFLGVGLKPYLLLIPLAAVAARTWSARSARPLVAIENVSLVTACAVYLLWVVFAHPAYLAEIVPLGQFVYWAYGVPLDTLFLGLSGALIVVASIAVITRNADQLPLAAALIGALASFYIQGKFWSYHLVPAIGLGILLALSLRDKAGVLLAVALVACQIYRGPHSKTRPAPIPEGVSSVAVLIQHVMGAYPGTLNCGIRHTTRYPAIWVIPGAWNIVNNPDRSLEDRKRAKAILDHEREIIRGDIIRGRPELILVDRRITKPYFQYPFSYEDFLGPFSGYSLVGKTAWYRIYSRVGTPVWSRCRVRV